MPENNGSSVEEDAFGLPIGDKVFGIKTEKVAKLLNFELHRLGIELKIVLKPDKDIIIIHHINKN